jgi:hypothetical protein
MEGEPHRYLPDYLIRLDTGEPTTLVCGPGRPRPTTSSDDLSSGWSKEIWDMATIAWLVNPDWCPSVICPDLPRLLREARGACHGRVMQYDLPLDELPRYRPRLDEIVAAGFDDFWQATLASAEAAAEAPDLVRVEIGLTLVESFDLTFSGYGGQRVRGWLNRPAGDAASRPCILSFLGYGGGRGLPEEHLAWAAEGYGMSSWMRADRARAGTGDAVRPARRRTSVATEGRRPPGS